MIHSVTFEFEAQKHEDAHLSIPKDARTAIGLPDEAWIHRDLATHSGRAIGEFWMNSGGEVRVTKDPGDPNRPLIGVVHAGEWGMATVSKLTHAKAAAR